MSSIGRSVGPGSRGRPAVAAIGRRGNCRHVGCRPTAGIDTRSDAREMNHRRRRIRTASTRRHLHSSRARVGDQIEHRLWIAGRGRHRLQHVDGRGLMLNPLAEFALALSQRRVALHRACHVPAAVPRWCAEVRRSSRLASWPCFPLAGQGHRASVASHFGG